MRLTDVLRTSGLRIGVYFLILFSASSLALIALIYWRTEAFLTQQTDSWLQREASALIHDTPAQRLESLARHIDNDVTQARPFALFGPDRKPVAGETISFPEVTKRGMAASFPLNLNGKTEKYRGIVIDLPGGQTLLVSQNAHLIQRFSQDLIGVMAAGSGLLVLVGLDCCIFSGLVNNTSYRSDGVDYQAHRFWPTARSPTAQWTARRSRSARRCRQRHA